MSNQQKLYQAVANVFQVDVQTVSDASSQDTIAKWDSLGMLNLVAELEEEFAVQFDILEIADFRSVGIIKTILAEKGIAF